MSRTPLRQADVFANATSLNIHTAGQEFDSAIRRLVSTTKFTNEEIANKLYPTRERGSSEGYFRFVKKIERIKADETGE